jgi:hypothetical protein
MVITETPLDYQSKLDKTLNQFISTLHPNRLTHLGKLTFCNGFVSCLLAVDPYEPTLSSEEEYSCCS